MSMIICVCAPIGSLIPQNLCSVSVTGTRKSTISQDPILARNPNRMLNPPTSAISPENGTAQRSQGDSLRCGVRDYVPGELVRDAHQEDQRNEESSPNHYWSLQGR